MCFFSRYFSITVKPWVKRKNASFIGILVKFFLCRVILLFWFKLKLLDSICGKVFRTILLQHHRYSVANICFEPIYGVKMVHSRQQSALYLFDMRQPTLLNFISFNDFHSVAFYAIKSKMKNSKRKCGIWS